MNIYTIILSRRKLKELIKEFVEGVHHKREESIYFSQILGHDSSLKKEVEKFTDEHQFGRNTVGKLADDLTNFAEKGDEQREPLIRYLKTYASYISPHLEQEEKFLDTVESKILSKDDDAKIYEQYKADSATNKHAELMVKQIDYLETRPWYIS